MNFIQFCEVILLQLLGQCKAQLFKFVRFFLFSIFFLFLVSVLQSQPSDRHARVHWPPINKFVCKLHGYIVYFQVQIFQIPIELMPET